MQPSIPTPPGPLQSATDDPEMDQDDNKVCVAVVCELDEFGSFYFDF